MDTNLSSKQNTNPFFSDQDDLKVALLQNYLSGSIILGTVIFFINLFMAIQRNDLALGGLTFLLFLVLFVITFTRSIHYSIKSILLASLYIAVGVMSIISTGINANSVIYFFTAILLLGLLLPGYWWVFGLVFEGLLISVFGLFIQYGLIQLNTFFSLNNSLLNWFTTITISLFLSFVIVSPLTQYLSKLHKREIETKNNSLGLLEKNQALSERIDLLEIESDKQRSKQIAARQITREITQQSDLQKILDGLVELVCTQLGFTYAGVFLADERNEYAVLQAANGAAGRQLIEQGHRLRIREEGIVGYVIARGETRLALDVDIDSVHFKNPLLPDTRSEIGIPLKTVNKVFGALDVQSDKESAFSQEDIEVLQSIADQLAVMISKTIQISSLEGEISDLKTGLGENVRGIWRTHLQGSKKNLAFRYSNEQLQIEDSTPLLEADNAAPQTISVEKGDQGSVLRVPIRLRDQILGVINLRYNGKKVPPRMINLVTTATDRLAVALENARLLETIEERADREHTVSEISSRVRSAQTIESILKTAVTELGKTLGVNEVSIQLKTTANTEQE
jgi:GAF domain-containing protein